MRPLVLILLLLSALGAVFWTGVQYERAGNLEAVTQAQKALFELGLVIQRKQAETVQATQQAQEAENERIRAIETTTEGLQRAQKRLASCLRKSKDADKGTNRGSPAPDYRLYSPAAIVRLWNEARRAPALPEVDDSFPVRFRTSPPATDAGATVKYLIGQYNWLAIQYVGLLKSCRAATTR